MADAKARDLLNCSKQLAGQLDLATISVGAEEVIPLYSKETMTLF